jgi:uncharacterized membrane protein
VEGSLYHDLDTINQNLFADAAGIFGCRFSLAGFHCQTILSAIPGGFYLLFIFGMMVFVIYPAIKANTVMHALLLGMLYGLVTYATYDLTNLALLKGWPLKIVVVDILWGIVLSGIVSTAGYRMAKWLF